MSENVDSTKIFEERRQVVVDRRLGLERRRGPGIRRSEERKSAEEGEMNDEQFIFLMAMLASACESRRDELLDSPGVR